MNILVLNCGSSSLKYRLIAMPLARELAGGEAQRVGPKTAEPARIVHRRAGGPVRTMTVEMPGHAAAFEQVMRLLDQEQLGKPAVIGHRIVHGGDQFSRHVLIDEAAIRKLESVQDMAPIHNPRAIALVKACRRIDPTLPQVAVFDTAFHSTLPDYASCYALPRALADELGIRKYGFHGISHRYVAEEAARILHKPIDRLNAVSCHLGSGGASLCAIVRGKSVDNTMGYSPLQGLIMSTRCGDLDPAIALQLLAYADGDADAVEKTLNEQSGVLGLSGASADIRDALSDSSGQDQPLNPTSQVYLWRLRKYLGAYLATVKTPDAILFTDTIGETVPFVRWTMCSGLECFGVCIDDENNRHAGTLPVDIATHQSTARILVIATNEELSIAREAYQLVTRMKLEEVGS